MGMRVNLKHCTVQVGCKERFLMPRLSQPLGRQAPFQGSNTRCAHASSSGCGELDRRQVLKQSAALCGALLVARWASRPYQYLVDAALPVI